MTELPKVRLSMDGKWAVCFATSCGFSFARRIDGVPDFLGGPVLDFGPGWVTDGYLWWMPRRIWERVSQGRQPAFRREPMGRSGRQGRDRSHRPWRWSSNARNLPAEVICPACGRLQLADSDLLEVPKSRSPGT